MGESRDRRNRRIGEDGRVRILPITSAGALVSDTTCILLGYMFYPEDERSARQLAGTFAEECDAVEEGSSISALAEGVFDRLPYSLLCLMGEMAIYVAHYIDSTGEPFFGRSAHVASEDHSTNKTAEGKALPTSESRIRKPSGTIHRWLISGRRINFKTVLIAPAKLRSCFASQTCSSPTS